MTEVQFWNFLEGVLWPVHGRESMMAGTMDCPSDPQLQAAGHYLMSHALLPRDCDDIPVEFILCMVRLLLEEGLQNRTREAIMIILPHNGSDAALDALKLYDMRPNKGLEVFAQMALEECEG